MIMKMRNIKDALANAGAYLKNKGADTPALDAEVLLAGFLGLSRAALYANWERKINSREAKLFFELLKRRADGEPVAYLVGHREFMGLDFAVNSHVLIPRPETELLVEKALEILHQTKKQGGERLLGRAPCDAPIVVDVGAGSGAIAVSVAKYNPDVRVYAIDKSCAALEVARVNAQKHDVSDRIFFLCGDLLEPLGGMPPATVGAESGGGRNAGQVNVSWKSSGGPPTDRLRTDRPPTDRPPVVSPQTDNLPRGSPPTASPPTDRLPVNGPANIRPGTVSLIVANLPYIPSDKLPGLQRDVGFEPRLALDGGPDGLALFRRFIVQAHGWLRPGGYLLAEIGAGQGAQALAITGKCGDKMWDAQLLVDLAGRDRLLCAQKVYN